MKANTLGEWEQITHTTSDERTENMYSSTETQTQHIAALTYSIVMLGIVLLLFYELLMNQYQDSENTSSSCDYHISTLISWNESLENTKWCGTYSLSLCLCIPWCIQVTIVYIMLQLRDLINVSHCENVTKTFQYFYILLPTLHQVTYCNRYVYFSSNI